VRAAQVGLLRYVKKSNFLSIIAKKRVLYNTWALFLSKTSKYRYGIDLSKKTEISVDDLSSQRSCRAGINSNMNAANAVPEWQAGQDKEVRPIYQVIIIQVEILLIEMGSGLDL
jgi:hypothetical protein